MPLKPLSKLLLFLFLSLLPVSIALAQPPVAVFYGEVKLDGTPVPDGTEISAWIEGEKVAETSASSSKYKLKIVQPEGKNFENKKVRFKVGKDFATEVGVWAAGEIFNLNLNAVSMAPRVAFFRGTVRINNDTVADGTEISAWIDDEKVASTTAEDSSYFLRVEQPRGRHFEGKSVVFKIGEIIAEQTAVWQAGAEVELNLTATTLSTLLALFSGTVSIDGQAVPDGTPVTAWIEGEKVGQTFTSNSRYALSIEQPGDKNFQGKSIIFKVAELQAEESAIWAAGVDIELNLTAKTSALVKAHPLLESVNPKRPFTVEIFIDPKNYGVSSAEIEMAFDPKAFEVIEVRSGLLLGEKPLIGDLVVENRRGYLKYALARLGRTQPPTSPGSFALVQFRAREEAPLGKHVIAITRASLTDENFKDIPNIKVESASLKVVSGVLGDINGDGRVNYKDLAILGAAYGTARGEAGFVIEADLNDDGLVDFRDLGILGVNYGKS